MPLKPAAHNEAGLLAYALLSKLIDSLIAKGVISHADVLGFVQSAADDFSKDSRANARLARDFLIDLAKTLPHSE